MNLGYKLVALLVCAVVCGCVKDPNDVSGGDGFTIDNGRNEKSLNVVVYASEQDYINSTNNIAVGIAPRHTGFTIPKSKLTPGNTYYVDVYSDDYMFTNWTAGNDPIIGREKHTPRKFVYEEGNNTFYLTSLGIDPIYARICLLNKTQGETKWKAVSALDLKDGSNVWYLLSQYEQFAGVTISKNLTGTFSYLSAGGDTTTKSFSFSTIVGYPVFSIIPKESNLGFFINNTNVNPLPELGLDQPPTIDSIIALINKNLYILKRQ